MPVFFTWLELNFQPENRVDIQVLLGSKFITNISDHHSQHEKHLVLYDTGFFTEKTKTSIRLRLKLELSTEAIHVRHY